jgi:hypothetical protein
MGGSKEAIDTQCCFETRMLLDGGASAAIGIKGLDKLELKPGWLGVYP